jgi:hypothetical protein
MASWLACLTRRQKWKISLAWETSRRESRFHATKSFPCSKLQGPESDLRAKRLDIQELLKLSAKGHYNLRLCDSLIRSGDQVGSGPLALLVAQRQLKYDLLTF